MPSESAIQQLREKRRAAREMEPAPADTREEILAATERVLATTPIHELSIERIIRDAGVSRRTFYSYFASKFDAVAALHARVIEEFYAVVRPFLGSADGTADLSSITTMLTTSAVLWRKHLAIGRAVQEHWQSEPTLGAQWLAFVERFSESVGAEIDRQREAGLAPAGVDSRQLAASLLWTTQNLMYVATSDAQPNVLTEQGALETLRTIWIGAIYGPR
ncbi:MAG: TetR/AcrR family transcriptional regulator [Solirubrobacteraceae bacterium]